MNDSVFLDTNVLVYAFDRDDERKQVVASKLVQASLSSGTGVTSTQVLQEFFVTVTKKVRVSMSVTDARRTVEDLARLRLVEIDLPLILGAIDRHHRCKIPFWDALIVGAAAAARCTSLFSEDLAGGSVLDGVQIINPFG